MIILICRFFLISRIRLNSSIFGFLNTVIIRMIYSTRISSSNLRIELVMLIFQSVLIYDSFSFLRRVFSNFNFYFFDANFFSCLVILNV